MYEIDMHEPSEAFARAWQAAGLHIQNQGQGAVSWLRAHLNPPFLEHLSFRLGNMLFFVRIEAEGLDVPGGRRGLERVALGCNGNPCLMPMRLTGGTWKPVIPGWGLLDVRSGHVVDPPALISNQPVEMTDWELHDFAVQVVRSDLEQKGHQLMSWAGDPEINPSLWFVEGQGPAWVVVRAARYPMREAKAPSNWQAIADGCAHMSRTGYFASVSVACMDSMGAGGEIWRGHGLTVQYEGLQVR